VLGPLITEAVGARERAVTAADDESVDAVTNEVERGGAATLELAESGAASRADERAADRGKATDVVPADLQGDHASLADFS